MFKDHETTYVVASVCIVWFFTLLLAGYEIGFNTSDSRLQTTVAIAYGAGAATGMTLLTIGTFEVIMVLAKRRDKRLEEEALEKGRENERQLWKAWYKSLPEDVREKTPPPPSDE